jgi:tripeptide aminopeptidase
MDMRSADVKALEVVNEKFKLAVQTAVEEENKRWNNHGKITGAPELVGLRPAGETPVDSPIVQTALSVSRALGIAEVLREGSTDSNVPMNLHIPAITISGGGTGKDAHSLNESFDTRDSAKGTQRAVLLAVSLAR